MADPTSARQPLHLQIHQRLQQRILSGEWGFGVMLPSENVLCGEFGVARGTIRQVLAELEKEGLIRRERGRGTFITHLPRTETVSGINGHILSFIVPYVRDSFVPTILLGLESVARANGYVVLFNHVENTPEKQEDALRLAQWQGVAGIILYPVNSTDAGPVLRDLVQRQVPLVLVDRYLRGLSTSYVTCDNFGGGLRATQYLMGLGHQRIAFLSWEDSAITMEHRREGYRRALAEAGLALDPDLVWTVEGYPDIDSSALANYLQRPDRPTALFSANDQLALAVLRIARSLHISIPKDLSLIGFDDLEVSAQLDPPLTTIAQPAFEMGRKAGELIINNIKDQFQMEVAPSRVEQHILPTRLVIRQSCSVLNCAINDAGAQLPTRSSFYVKGGE